MNRFIFTRLYAWFIKNHVDIIAHTGDNLNELFSLRCPTANIFSFEKNFTNPIIPTSTSAARLSIICRPIRIWGELGIEESFCSFKGSSFGTSLPVRCFFAGLHHFLPYSEFDHSRISLHPFACFFDFVTCWLFLFCFFLVLFIAIFFFSFSISLLYLFSSFRLFFPRTILYSYEAEF